MTTENLMKACDTYDQFVKELRAAHSDAVNSDNQFAEIAVFSLIEQAAKLGNQLARLKDAAIQSDSTTKERKSE